MGIGTKVFSLNRDEVLELKMVINRFAYGGGKQRQKMIELTIDGETITATSNHEILLRGNWVSVGIIRERILEICCRDEQRLSNLDTRPLTHEELERLWERLDDETSLRRKYVSSYNDCQKWQGAHYQTSPIGSRGISSQSIKQAASQSQELQSERQPSGEPGVGNCPRELSTLCKEWAHDGVHSSSEVGAKQRCERKSGGNFNLTRRTDSGDTSEVQTEKGNSTYTCFGVRCFTCHNKRYYFKEKLEACELDIANLSAIRLSEPTDFVYDLEVEDNHNYVVGRRNVVVHNSGKSWWLCEKQLIQAYQYPGIKSFIGREELKRLMASTYLTFTKVAQYHKIPKDDWKLNGQYNYIEFRNGSRIDLLDLKLLPSDPLYERFGSLEYTNGDIEEAGEVNFMAFDVLKSRVGRHRNDEFKLLPKVGLTCNPSKNFLYSLFYKPFKENRLPEQYAFIQALYQDNPYTQEIYGQQLSEITDKSTKERLMFGNWEYDDDPATLIEYDAVIDLFSNPPIESDDKYITADIARFGQDKTVIGFWRGMNLYKILVRQKEGVDQIATLIRTEGDKERVPRSHVLIDEDGVGGGVMDLLKGSKGFIANASPLEQNLGDNFRNLKAQCSYRLADVINRREMSITALLQEQYREMIIEELEQIKSKDADKDGKRQIIPKDDVKERIGRSPDFSDMMMMRMYFELDSSGIKNIAKVYRPTLVGY